MLRPTNNNLRTSSASYSANKETQNSKESSSSAEETIAEVILEKIIIELEEEVLSLLEKEKENLEIIESLKSKGSELSENAISDSENQSENDCHEVEKVASVSLFKIGTKMLSESSRKDLLSIIVWHFCDVNDLFVFDDVSIRKSQVSKMPFRKKPRDSLNVHSKSNSNKSLPRTVFRWLPKMQPLAEPVAKWIPKHMTGNRALLTNFVEKFLKTVRFGNNDFAVIAGYGDVVIGSMTIKKVYYRVRTDNGTEFKNKTLAKFFDEVGISQQFSAVRERHKQKGVVKGGNRLRCYLLNDYDDVGKLKAKGDIGVFVLEYSKESQPSEFTINELSKDSTRS
ncbi:integrase, catalytic region, zinc finger, CCHC-type containing protein [Tanacetum coccineum]